MKEKSKTKKVRQAKEVKSQQETVAYRLKCAKTANGLSHFVMYGDVKKDKALL